MLAMPFGCGFGRSELAGLELDEIQMSQGLLTELFQECEAQVQNCVWLPKYR